MIARRETPAAFWALAASGVIWGTSFVLGKIALRELTVPHMILYRFVLASLGFVPLLIHARVRIPRSDWPIFVAVGVVGVPVQFLLQFEGLARTTASHASLMIGTAPVLVALGGWLFFRERLRFVGWVALLASTVGVALIVTRIGGGGGGDGRVMADGASAMGDGLVICSIFASLVWVLSSKHLMKRYSPIAVSGVVTVVGTVPLIAWVLWRDGPPPMQLRTGTWWSVVALGLIATTIATMLWNWGLAHTDAGKAGAFINIEPVIGAVLGVWLLDESLGPLAVIGGLLIVGGALVVSLQPATNAEQNTRSSLTATRIPAAAAPPPAREP